MSILGDRGDTTQLQIRDQLDQVPPKADAQQPETAAKRLQRNQEEEKGSIQERKVPRVPRGKAGVPGGRSRARQAVGATGHLCFGGANGKTQVGQHRGGASAWLCRLTPGVWSCSQPESLLRTLGL